MLLQVFKLNKCDILGVQAYLAGLTFALAASPCSTPVLATLLGYVATSKVLSNAYCSIIFFGWYMFSPLQTEKKLVVSP